MTDTNRGRVRIEPSHRRVRAFIAGHVVVDTIHPTLVWEGPHYPAYYLPVADLRAELRANGGTAHSPSRGEGVKYDVVVGGVTTTDAALRYPDSPIEELRELVRLEWSAMDEWFEEDEPVYVHPRSPYTRVDVLASSRRVRVVVDGVTVAESTAPRILFETGLPPRYYLPLTDLRQDLLTPSQTRTGCPYKGTAEYFDVRIGETVHRDLVWLYRTPLPESQKIAGLGCFYNEKVDLYVDDVLRERPRTAFS